MPEPNANSRICVACVGDPDVKQFILDQGSPGDCYIHGHVGEDTITIREMGEVFADRFGEFYTVGGYERVFDGHREEGRDVQTGESPAEILEEHLWEDEPVVTSAIIEYLAERDRPRRQGDPDESYWDTDLLFEFQHVPTDYHGETWSAFKDLVTHRRRFFAPEAFQTLVELFDPNGAYRAWGPNRTPMRVVNRGDFRVFRGRIANNLEAARTIAENPVPELCPPPLEIVLPGRLNPRGIRRFYGALDKATCIAELRPSIGDYIVMAEFSITDSLLLYDFSVFTDRFYTPNLFDLAVDWRDITRRKFLEELHADITRPVTPGEEELRYLPTQMIAEYLQCEADFDGVITRSAQIADEEALNLTLFDGDYAVEGDPSRQVHPVMVEGQRLPGSLTPVPGQSSIVQVTEANHRWEEII